MPVKELSDLPSPSTYGEETGVFHASGRALVIYEISELAKSQGYAHECALVEFFGCRRVLTGGPNDEALGRHPAAKWGLHFYSIQEIVDSPMIAEQERTLHKDGKVGLHPRFRHFVLAMKEDTVDVFAKDYRLVGMFPNRPSAMTAAVEMLISGMDAA